MPRSGRTEEERDLRRSKRPWRRSTSTNSRLRARKRPVIKLANIILVQAIKDRASDIHIEPFEKGLRLRYRIDGVLVDATPPPKQMQLALTSRFKIMSSLDIAERRLPQDGRMRVKVGGQGL